MKKRILILCKSDLSRDPRVYKQILALKDHYEVATAALAPSGIEGVEFIQLEPELDIENDFPKQQITGRIKNRLSYLAEKSFRPHEHKYWSWNFKTFLKRLPENKFDGIWANDIDTLPLALRIAQGKNLPVHFDAHEYSPGQHHFKSEKQKQYITHLCRKYIPMASSMSTVSNGIARIYGKYFSKPIKVLANVPSYQDLSPSEINPSEIKLVHHGGTNRARNLEELILMMDLLDERFSLDLYLMVTHEDYNEKLKSLAAKRQRVRILDPVEMNAIASTLNPYDIGVYMLPNQLINHKYAMPNKLFEFMQARLAIAVGPTEDMADFVRRHELGVVSKGFSATDMARELNQLSDDQILAFKEKSHSLADKFSFENQREEIVAIVNDLL